MIDFHTHSPLRNTGSWLGGADFQTHDFVSFMDSAGLESCVVLSHDGLFNPSPEANDELAEFVAPEKGRLVAFGTVNPRRADAAAETERCFAELDMGGIKLHPWLQGFSMHEQSLDPICEVIAAAGGILLCHDGTPPYSTPLQIAALARRHPTLPVVLGHGGLHDCWREALVAVQETANLHICLCGTPPYAAARIIADAPEDKVLFGTDAGLSQRVGQEYAVARVRELALWDITDADRQRVLVDNPRRLLGGRL